MNKDIKDNILKELNSLNDSIDGAYRTIHRMIDVGFPSYVYEKVYAELDAMEATRNTLIGLLRKAGTEGSPQPKDTSPKNEKA